MFKVLSSRLVVGTSFVATCLGFNALIKQYSNPRYEGKERLDEKTVIITGSNTGIGKEVAREVARRGARVIMACRNEEKCMEARKEIILETKNSSVVCRQLDLASLESIRQFVDRIKKTEKSVDVLVNNAAVMNCPKSKTKDGFEMQLGVNHLGHFLLTMLLLDKIKASEPSRIINVSSVAHQRGIINFEDINSDKNYSPTKAYSQSKLANILFTQELAKRLEGTQVNVYCMHPGLVNTELFRHMGFYNSITRFFIKPILWLLFISPKMAAHSVLYCILSPEIKSLSGKYFARSKLQETSDAAKDEVAAKKLWLISEKWTKLK